MFVIWIIWIKIVWFWMGLQVIVNFGIDIFFVIQDIIVCVIDKFNSMIGFGFGY